MSCNFLFKVILHFRVSLSLSVVALVARALFIFLDLCCHLSLEWRANVSYFVQLSMGNPISNTSFLEPTVCFILFRSVVHLHSFRLKKSSIKRVFEFPYKFSYAQTREFYWQTYFKRWQIIAIFQIPAHACHFFDLVFSSPCNLLLLSPRGVEAARLLHYHNHIWKKKGKCNWTGTPVSLHPRWFYFMFSRLITTGQRFTAQR